MTREWTEDLARTLCWVTLALLLFFLAVIGGRVAARLELWRPPDTGTAGTIALWGFMALGLLFGMDRGIPKEGLWGFRLYVLRKVLVVAILATVATFVTLR